MRLPVTRLAMAFPELDGLTDVERERLLERWKLASYRVRRIPFIWGFSASFFWFGLLSILFEKDILAFWPLTVANGDLFRLAVLPLGAIVSGSLVGLVARDFCLRRELRRMLTDVFCISCEHSLRGLPVVESSVTCPECGRDMTLDELHVDEQQLGAR